MIRTVVDATRKFDPTRPVTFACNQAFYSDKAVSYFKFPETGWRIFLKTQFVDVIMINRYFNWYNNPGRVESATYPLRYELEQWRAIHKKPMMVSEYGAGAIPGLHKSPPVMWSEEYQVRL